MDSGRQGNTNRARWKGGRSYLMQLHQGHVSGGRNGFGGGGHFVFLCISQLTFSAQLPSPRPRLQHSVHATAEVWDWRRRRRRRVSVLWLVAAVAQCTHFQQTC